jgi:hypothetical protein
MPSLLLYELILINMQCGCHSVVLVGSLAAHVLPQLLEHLANDHYLRRCHRWFLA